MKLGLGLQTIYAQLLPCPFCGHTKIETHESYESGWRVECRYCEAQIGGYNTEKGAMVVWNERRGPSVCSVHYTLLSQSTANQGCWQCELCREEANHASTIT